MVQRLFKIARGALRDEVVTGGTPSNGYRLVWRGGAALGVIEGLVQDALLAAVEAGERSWRRRRVRVDSSALRESVEVTFDGLSVTLSQWAEASPISSGPRTAARRSAEHARR